MSDYHFKKILEAFNERETKLLVNSHESNPVIEENKNKLQTAVDWAHSKILLRIGLDDNDILLLRKIMEQAKEKQMNQIIEAYDRGVQDTIGWSGKDDAIKYYLENYK